MGLAIAGAGYRQKLEQRGKSGYCLVDGHWRGIRDKLRQNSFCQAQVVKSLNPLIEESSSFLETLLQASRANERFGGDRDKTSSYLVSRDRQRLILPIPYIVSNNTIDTIYST